MAWKAGRDAAVSPVIATIILVAIAIVLSGILYAAVHRPSTDAAAIAFTAWPPDRDDERTLIIASATPNLAWSRMTLLLDGDRLTYDDALASDGTWCLLADGCVAEDAFDLSSMVRGGDKIRVHHPGAPSGEFQAIDVDANMILAKLTLKP